MFSWFFLHGHSIEDIQLNGENLKVKEGHPELVERRKTENEELM